MNQNNQEYPSLAQQGKNLLDFMQKAAGEFLKRGVLSVPNEVAMSRIEICKTCDRYDERQFKCTACGCWLPVKTQSAAASCPLKKWEEYQSN